MNAKDARAEVRRIGVCGAGTMGSGIAQCAALAGFETLMQDPFEEALATARERIEESLGKGRERGRWSAEDVEAARKRLAWGTALEELAGCQLVIEAAPERLDLKRELFEKLSRLLGPRTILATNTSSLPVTAVASAAAEPANVVGMHFFNPPALMELLELVAGSESSESALAIARRVGERMGKRVIAAKDGPGFLANRCARPFGLEALKLAQEGIADFATIDRIVRMGGGFRMGPFELMDLVGIDVGFEVTKSFWEQSFHEPRWRPSMISERMVQAGRLGRKSGRGYYDYSGGEHRPPDPEPTEPDDGSGRSVVIEGDGNLAVELRQLASRRGFELASLDDPDDRSVELLIDASVGRTAGDMVLSADDDSTTLCVLCVDGSLAELDASGNAVGLHALPPLAATTLVELTRSAGTSDKSASRVESFFRTLGKRVEWVGDAPGLVLGRIFGQLVNEACFALSEQIGRAEDIDTAMRYGYNYPRGPLEWADIVGLDHVMAMLEALHSELGEERYRASPLLPHMVAEGKLGVATGEGFFSH